MSVKWTLQKTDPREVDQLSKDLGVNHIIAHLLVLRGITKYDQAEHFFRPQVNHLHNPFLMKGMLQAVERIQLAIKRKEKILFSQ